MKVCLYCKYPFSFKEWTCLSCGHQPKCTNGFETHVLEFAYDDKGFKPDYLNQLSQLEAESLWFHARYQIILWELGKYYPNISTFLEVGCGTSFVLSGVSNKYPNLVLSGSEILLAGLSHAAKSIPSEHFMQMDARKAPLIDEFDVIGAFDVLEHIEEEETVLKQLHDAIKPSGVLSLTVS